MLIARRSIQSDWYLEAPESFVRAPQEQRKPNLRDALSRSTEAPWGVAVVRAARRRPQQRRGGEGGTATSSAAAAVRAGGKSAGRHGWDAQRRRGGEGGGATSSAAAGGNGGVGGRVWGKRPGCRVGGGGERAGALPRLPGPGFTKPLTGYRSNRFRSVSGLS